MTVAIVLASATGCTGAIAPTGASTETITSPAGAPEAPPASPRSGSVSPAPHDAEPAPLLAAVSETLDLAARSVSAYCRPTVEYDTWISELYPFLSQSAAVAYETVDPANVPCTTVIGDAFVRDGDEAFTMRVVVPTDAGEYSVYVHRSSEAAAWAVEQITPLTSE